MVNSAWNDRIVMHIRSNIIEALVLRNQLVVHEDLSLGDILGNALDQSEAIGCMIKATNLMNEVVG